MPTQRPFLSNFLAAFRNHTQPLPKAAPAIATSTASTSAATLWTAATATPSPKPQPSEPAPTSPRPIKQPYTSAQTLQHAVSPSTHLPRSPSSTGLPVYGPPNKPAPSYPTCQETRRARRGSDSSSEGFRDVRSSSSGGPGAEKWFIGGKTAGGEEKYYKLAMVRRERSADRRSEDQLSL